MDPPPWNSDEFDARHLGAVAVAGAQLEDAGVPAVALGVARGDLVDQHRTVGRDEALAELRLPADIASLASWVSSWLSVIGISLGAGVEAEALSQIGAWSVSLAMLLACLATTLFVGTVLLQRVFRMNRNTAILAASPGTMSNAIALALDGWGDATSILILQMIRLLALVTIVPPVAMLIDAQSGFAPAASMDIAPLALLIGAALALGLRGTRAGIPASCLLFGMILSAAAHLAGLAKGPAPEWVVSASFVITGTALGVRLTAVSAPQLIQMSKAGLFLVVSATFVSLCFAGITHILTGLPLAQVWIAFAPGGVEAMAAIGLALGYDPAYVAIHHFTRILVLVAAIPFIMRRKH